MNNTNANLNISKKNKQLRSNYKNNFNKSLKYKKNNISKINFNNNNIKNFHQIITNNNFYNSIDFPIAKTNSNQAASQLHFPSKDIIKSSIIYNKRDNKNKNKQYTLKISNSNKFLSFNCLSSKKIFDNSSRKKLHNIRLNLNKENVNKDLYMNNNKKINKRKNKDILYTEQIKEKNNRINKLQKDIIISEIILKKLKNKEDKSDTFFENNYESINSNISNNISNTNITRINIEKNHKILTVNLNMDSFNNRKVSSLTNLRPLLTFNYINNNNIICNNNYKKGVSPENKPIPKNNYFYSLPNNNNSNYNKGSFSSKNKNKTKIIFVKKSGPFCERNINDDKSKYNKNEFENFVKKCENLKNRSKEIFNKYIKLSETIINNKNCKNSNVK